MPSKHVGLEQYFVPLLILCNFGCAKAEKIHPKHARKGRLAKVYLPYHQLQQESPCKILKFSSYINTKTIFTFYFHIKISDCNRECHRDGDSCAGFVKTATACHLGHPSNTNTLLSSPQPVNAAFYFEQGL